MRLLIVQKDTRETDITPYLELAESRRVEAVCFGELALSGAMYQRRPVEPLESVLARFAPYDVAIMVGLPIPHGQSVTNSYLYYHRGKHLIYDKINLFPGMNEPAVYCPGKTPAVWNTPFGKLGVSICYDIRFPDLYQELKSSGAEVLFVPAAFPLVRIDDYRRLLIERAKEHHMTVIGINCVGDDGINVFGGNSIVVAPDGTVLAEADRLNPTTIEISV
jgi:predicted amidohydrolase